MRVDAKHCFTIVIFAVIIGACFISCKKDENVCRHISNDVSARSSSATTMNLQLISREEIENIAKDYYDDKMLTTIFSFNQARAMEEFVCIPHGDRTIVFGGRLTVRGNAYFDLRDQQVDVSGFSGYAAVVFNKSTGRATLEKVSSSIPPSQNNTSSMMYYELYKINGGNVVYDFRKTPHFFDYQ